MEKYNESFLTKLNDVLGLYMHIGSGVAESPMWMQYNGVDEETQMLKFSSSQRPISFEIPMLHPSHVHLDYMKTYEYFRNLKYSHIKENFPTVWSELR